MRPASCGDSENKRGAVVLTPWIPGWEREEPLRVHSSNQHAELRRRKVVFSRLDAMALHIGDFADDSPVARHREIANFAGHGEKV